MDNLEFNFHNEDLPQVPDILKINPSLHRSKFHCTWDVAARNEAGEIVSRETDQNIVVIGGRENVLNLLFALAASSTVVALGAGASGTAATATDTRLNYELVGNASRKPLTNTSFAPLSSADVVLETFVDGFGETYYTKIIVQGVYQLVDGNNGQPFQEYGLFSTTALPGTPTSTSGIMFNHFVAGAPVVKDNTITITVQVTIRV
jgi:hypothetical protein